MKTTPWSTGAYPVYARLILFWKINSYNLSKEEKHGIKLNIVLEIVPSAIWQEKEILNPGYKCFIAALFIITKTESNPNVLWQVNE